ncbi:hypothetical protein CGMCC3_g11516 [Colletotrichum fructicola]|nr:uncharacterized protein CGMCC3_g11516 [Colletotrichum fructicola]KAE9572482.1 hypothetical protein CGMCC3_g11516 [Colletotrichum fructicola]
MSLLSSMKGAIPAAVLAHQSGCPVPPLAVVPASACPLPAFWRLKINNDLA